ncbi:cytochrome P450 [Mycena galericulata]|nr:cytochrome P450 [Mycena galericulata]
MSSFSFPPPLRVSASASAVVLTVVWVLWRKLRRSSLSDISGPKSDSWITGNLMAFFSPQAYEWHGNLVETFGSAVKFFGFFGDEQMYFTDPHAINHILKSGDVFEEQLYFLEGNKLWFGLGLLSTVGDMHKRQRRTISPVFSASHMRDLTPMVYSIARDLRAYMTAAVSDSDDVGSKELDFHDWMSRSSLDFISKCGMGYSFDALDVTKPNAYRDIVKNFIPVLVRTALIRQLIPWAVKLGPAWARRLMVAITPLEHVTLLKHFSDILWNTANEVLTSKQEALAKGDASVSEQIGQGKDIMSILLRNNNKLKSGEQLPQEELLGQISTLIFTAQDTTAAALSRMFQVLADHPDVQRQVREEVTTAHAQGDLSYAELMALPLLDAVCRETLRMYPPVAFTLRTTLMDAVVPLQRPIKGKSGKTYTSVHIPANTDVCVGIIGANKDKAIWGQDADEWKPSRWLSEMPAAVQDLPGIYYNMLTFGTGPRSCIGLKFAELEMKILACVLLERFSFDKPSTEIAWQLGNIQVPYAKGTEESLRPNLPLKVSILKDLC